MGHPSEEFVREFFASLENVELYSAKDLVQMAITQYARHLKAEQRGMVIAEDLRNGTCGMNR